MSQLSSSYTYCLSHNGVDDEWSIFAPGAERPFAAVPFWADPKIKSVSETEALAIRVVASLNAFQDLPTESLLQCPSNHEFQVIMASRHQIAVIWCIEDVQEIRPDLNDDQAWEVLLRVRRNHDAGIGINWETLELTAQNLFGDKPEDGLEE